MKHANIILIKSALFILILATLDGCGKKPEEATITSNFSSIYSLVLKKACIECHVPTGAATVDSRVRIDLTTQALAWQTITTGTVSGATSVGICPNVKLIDAGLPEKSYFAAVLFSDYAKSNFADVSGCTPYSVHLEPNGDQHLSSAEKSAIITWITNGAKND